MAEPATTPMSKAAQNIPAERQCRTN
jgi:hypothetical protein